MIKRLYNKSGSTTPILGRDVANDDYYDVQRNRFLELADDIYEEGDIYQKIQSGDIWVHDGDDFILDKDDAIRFCVKLSRIKIKHNDGTITRDPDSINFIGNVSSQKVGDQTNLNIGGVSNIGMLYPMSFVKNGSAQNKYSDSEACNIPSNYVMQPLPFNAQLIGIAFTNNREGADFDIEVWRCQRNDGINDVNWYEWQVRDGRLGYKTNISGKSANAGDKFALFIDDEGKNPNDMVITLIWKVLNDNNKEEFIENFSGYL